MALKNGPILGGLYQNVILVYTNLFMYLNIIQPSYIKSESNNNTAVHMLRNEGESSIFFIRKG